MERVLAMATQALKHFGKTLAMQFWDLNSICNEKTKTVAEVWVDEEIRLTFRRVFSDVMMIKWEELKSVIEQVVLNDDTDALVWGYESSRVLSSKSCYAIIGYRVVTHVFIPSIWKVGVPPKIQLFLWLPSHNKLATVDNLNKKGFKKPEQCCFCCENESIIHLFFECGVAKAIWGVC
jgi:hypothetical protein